MSLLSAGLAGFVALLHCYFLVLEMFFWTRPRGLKTFGQTLETAQSSSVLAANQGLYNGFLAAGLVWSLLHAELNFSLQLRIFFFACVSIAGIYGGATVNQKIFFVQALPALIGLVAAVLTILRSTPFAL